MVVACDLDPRRISKTLRVCLLSVIVTCHFQEKQKNKSSILQTSEEMMNIESKISEIKRIAVSVRSIRLHQAHAAGIQFLFQGLLIGH